MNDNIRIIVVDDTDETRKLVSRYLEFNDRFELVATAKNGKEAIEEIEKTKPDVVLMDINMPEMNGLEATEYISNNFPGIIVIIMSVQSEVDYMKKAMVSGAKEYIIKPFTIDDLNQTITSTYDKVADRIQLTQPVIIDNSTVESSEVMTFFSSKGGVGKSVIATNLAYALSKITKEKVALIDFDLQFGDIGMIINSKPKVTITELVDEHMSQEVDNIKNYLLPLTDNLDVLLAPRKPEFAEYISEKHIKDIVKTLRKKYRYIIIDTATNFEDTTLAALDVADRIYYVATMDLLAIKNTKLGLEVMQSLRYSQDKVQLLINRDVKSGIVLSEVEKTLNYKIKAVIPDESKTLLKSVNQGIPVVIGNHRGSKFTKAIQKICKQIIEEA